MDYDISEALQRIEREITVSLIRNLKKHRAEEREEGFEWTQWQALQLKELSNFRSDYSKKLNHEIKVINPLIEKAIKRAFNDGKMEEELSILKAIKNTKKGTKIPNRGTPFFAKDNKLEKLIEATTKDMLKAEHAILRRANDQYRKIIFNAQLYASSGAGTYEKAVDMATRDFLRAGINCVQYKNGTRVRASKYAEMAIRTATKRAYLRGQGEMREEWGISTVILNKRTSACPLCAPFVGKVFIDDVWSGGKKGDGKYPLLSKAIEAGLYHPNCKDAHTTYFPGISTPPEKISKAYLAEMGRAGKAEAKASYCKNQAEICSRLAEFSLDKDNRIAYAAQMKKWETAAGINTEYVFKPAESIEDAQKFAAQFCNTSTFSPTFKGEINYKGISLENANEINKALTEVYSKVNLDKITGIKVVSAASKQGRKAFKDGADAVFAYSPVEHGIFINKDILSSPKTFNNYLTQSKEAWDLVMGNIDKLSGEQKKIAMTYKNAGRSLVGGESVKDMFVHELGHHVQWTLLDTKTNNLVGSQMSKFAPKISGYANTSKSEYLAESFAAYIKGETSVLDPEYLNYLESKIRENKKSIVPSEFNAVLENKAVETLRKEYKRWGDSLTAKEIHAIHKYTKNSFDDVEPKFYKRLNAMLRGDISQDDDLLEYAETISGALKKKPLENGIVCYRRSNVQGYGNVKRGDILYPKQFVSTSVIRSRTLPGEYETVIFAPPGTLGAFLDKGISRLPNQREFLLDKDCKFRVISNKDNRLILQVEVN